MVLNIVVAYFPTQYLTQIVCVSIAVLFLRTVSQGRRTNRERDLHARVVIVTGGFTPTGLTLLQSLAERGAHVIALTPKLQSPRVSVLVDLLRSTASNEHIFAEECDLSSPKSIHAFCERFLKGEDKRIDAVIFAHEYQHVGPFSPLYTGSNEWTAKERDVKALATFLMTTLLLPVLLTAPFERDIRIINVVNRFYAAAAASPALSLEFGSPTHSLFLAEGTRSLRTIIFTRHLQRVLDALPTAPVPQTDTSTSAVPVVSHKNQVSNIVAVSVSPGISRVDTISAMLNADWNTSTSSSWLGILLYTLLLPLLHIFAKSPFSAMQDILHALFLPTPMKILSQAGLQAPTEATRKPEGSGAPIDASVLEMPEEVLKPGSLYAECAIVKLNVKVSLAAAKDHVADEKQGTKTDGKEDVKVEDDGELGGEAAGRFVWELYELALKDWEKAEKDAESSGEPAKSGITET